MSNPKSVTMIFTLEQVKAIANESGTFLNIVMNSLDKSLEGMTIDADPVPTSPVNVATTTQGNIVALPTGVTLNDLLDIVKKATNKIEGIKNIRGKSKMGLKEAKDFFELHEHLAINCTKPYNYNGYNNPSVKYPRSGSYGTP